MRSRRELFVYYRIRPGTEAEAAAAVKSFQRALMLRVPGLLARLLRKDDAVGTGAPTWMEVYSMTSQPPVDAREVHVDIDASLQNEIGRAAAAVAGCIEGSRHVEAFVTTE